MAYVKTNWRDGKSPHINATNLNNIEGGILTNSLAILTADGKLSALTAKQQLDIKSANAKITTNIAAISKNLNELNLIKQGFHPQGNFSPVANGEYPDSSAHTSEHNGWSFTIHNVGEHGYKFIAGNLKGHTVFDGDHIYWIDKDPHWHILTNSNTANDILSKLLTVDGKHSGLDVERLGGVEWSKYALISAIPSIIASLTHTIIHSAVFTTPKGRMTDSPKGFRVGQFGISDNNITFEDAGGIEMNPTKGEKVKIATNVVVTGAVTGTTLKLYI